MADGTRIEWTDATWNPITGCTLVSEGCRNCYAAELAAGRLAGHPSRNGLAVRNADGVAKFTGEMRFNAQWLGQPLRWRKARMVFVCAHGDLFHENVPDAWIDRVFAVMALCPQHKFQLLTKRPKRMRAYLERDPRDDINGEAGTLVNWDEMAQIDAWPLPNVWLGVSVEDQATADERIPVLLDTPAAIRWVSAEPLLGPVDLAAMRPPYSWGVNPDGWVFNALEIGDIYHLHYQNSDGEVKIESGDGPYRNAAIDWLVVGGESGRNARPMHPDWARSLRDQCVAAGVPFLFKQWGAWTAQVGRMAAIDFDPAREAEVLKPLNNQVMLESGLRDGRTLMERVGKKAAGRMLDGVIHDAWPEVVR